jgi:hypothetical protein
MAKLVQSAEKEELGLQEVEKSIVRLVKKAQHTISNKQVSIFTLHRLKSFHAGQDMERPSTKSVNEYTCTPIFLLGNPHLNSGSDERV